MIRYKNENILIGKCFYPTETSSKHCKKCQGSNQVQILCFQGVQLTDGTGIQCELESKEECRIKKT